LSSVAIVYILTAIVSIVIGIALVNFTRLSAQAKISADRKTTFDDDTEGGESLKKSISDEISEFIDSMQECQRLTTRLVDVVTREVEERVSKNIEVVTQKYEKIIEEKTRNEEVALKKYNKTLGEKRETDAVIRSIAEGLVVVDGQGKVIMMNPAAEKLLGASAKDKIGRPVAEGIKDEQLISLVRESKDKQNKEVELVSQQDETKKVLRASTAVIENETGQTVGMVSVLSDITKQKELDQMKTNFVSHVSHELRTPLVAMEKSISLILSKSTGEITETQEQFLSIADRNLKRLGLLINDLLDLSKLEAGKMEMKLEPTAIGQVIEETIQTLNTWAGTKSVALKKEVEPGMPDAQIDANRIIQVLTNLIGNAIKFTPANGYVTVRAARSSGQKEVRVSVEDTGIGMSPADLPKVFDKFYQIGERAPTDISGTGIGLTIAKEIVERHGGRIWAESEKGAGAKFIFTLPLK
jgi:PAS domain S-box-containing protein